LTALERGVRLRDVPGRGDQQTAGQLGGGDDVGGRCVDDHHTGLGGGGDVDVVEADPGAGDHLQLPRRGDGLGVHLRRAAHHDRVHVRDGGEQIVPVRSVAVADL